MFSSLVFRSRCELVSFLGPRYEVPRWRTIFFCYITRAGNHCGSKQLSGCNNPVASRGVIRDRVPRRERQDGLGEVDVCARLEVFGRWLEWARDRQRHARPRAPSPRLRARRGAVRGDAHQEAPRFARAERGRSMHVSSAMLASCSLCLVALFVIVDPRFGVIASRSNHRRRPHGERSCGTSRSDTRTPGVGKAMYPVVAHSRQRIAPRDFQPASSSPPRVPTGRAALQQCGKNPRAAIFGSSVAGSSASVFHCFTRQ